VAWEGAERCTAPWTHENSPTNGVGDLAGVGAAAPAGDAEVAAGVGGVLEEELRGRGSRVGKGNRLLGLRASIMGVLNWLKSIDDRFVGSARDTAIDARARQAALNQEQAAQVMAALASGQIKAESLAPEVLHHLVQLQRGRQAPEQVTQARQALGSTLGFVPADGSTATKDQLIALLRDRGVVADKDPMYGPVGRKTKAEMARQYSELANAVAGLRTAAAPSMGVRLQGGLAGLSDTIANNAYARGAAYAGMGGGAVAGGYGLTEAGRALLELSGVLGAEDEEGSPMA